MCCEKRTSILVLGTLKLFLVNLLALGLCSYQLLSVRFLVMPMQPLMQLWSATLLMLFDAIFSIILLNGSFKRHLTSLRAYFHYSIAGFILSLLRVLHSIYLYSQIIRQMYTDYEGWRLVLYSVDFYISIVLFGLFNLVVQLCLMILVRQEISKLDSAKTSDGAELQHV